MQLCAVVAAAVWQCRCHFMLLCVLGRVAFLSLVGGLSFEAVVFLPPLAHLPCVALPGCYRLLFDSIASLSLLCGAC